VVFVEWKTEMKSAAILGILLALGLLLGGTQVKQAVGVWKQADRIVTVKGLAEREVQADLVLWPLSYSVTGTTLESTHAELAKGEEKIRSFLVRHGFAAEDITSTAPQVTDLWTYAGDNRPKDRYKADGVVLLRTAQVDRVKLTMPKTSELVADGVLISTSWEHKPQYIFTKLNDIKPEMIAEATRNAREAAEQFADDSDSKIGKIRSAQQGYFSVEDLDSYTPEIKKIRVVTTVEYLLVN
jgi:hypothetical protein